MSSVTLPAVGGTQGERDPDAGREADDYGPGAGGKKRKVPAYPQITGKNEEDDSDDQSSADDDSETKPTVFAPNYRLVRSRAAKACSFRKALFLRRKAALITLFLDAQSARSASTARIGSNKSVLPEIPVFEKLLPSLEDLGVNEWAPDQPGWRNNWDTGKSPAKTLEEWRTSLSERRRVRASRNAIVRGGWAPEGSFEFDMGCKGE